MGEGIGWAVKQLQNGERVRRAGWNGKGMWLALARGGVRRRREGEPETPVNLLESWGLGPVLLEAGHANGEAPVPPFVVMYTATGELVPWLCSQTDLLAADWEVASAQATEPSRPAGGATCCLIPDDQQKAARSGRPYTPCPNAAEWEITGVKAPGYPTLACTEHVGLLLDDDLHYVAPFPDTGRQPSPFVQTSAREG